ncbi:Tyrosine-protein kinase FRK [Rhizoctonia solani]|uniref:Tyrosine-protein kinase FRK n=1 Tax=Rhizoctonia solani TaxID=456999 RepID=A0A0K6GJE5_9AGAM|nr:Tyrosine-protein kinase FRK [Rhizoctonia solani]
MFNCLIASGCVDLSSHMDARQDTAMIVSGGGFGDIWKGQLHNGGMVAIKAWRTNALGNCDYKTLKRAARELYLWSRMDHPNIHRLRGVIMFRDQYLGMVSDWMDNGNLHEYLRKYPDIGRFELCLDIALGLEYMHSTNTVHGDLKAANVLVSSDGIARLSDFDFSVMSEVTSLVFSESSNSRAGSVRWMAPEILLVEEARARTTQSEVYALGMTMLEIFTEDVPYPDRRTDFAVISTVGRGTLPNRPIEQLGGDQKGDMMWHLLVQCWTRDPSDRPSSRQVVEIIVYCFQQLVSDDVAMSE